MGSAERQAIIRELETKLDARVICYLTSDRVNATASINKDVLPLLYAHLSQGGPPARVYLLMSTSGGDTIAAFGIARLLREFSPHVGVLVPLRCHSAGTLIALGANKIVMTRGATLSPIDPSVSGPLNPAIEVNPGQRQLVQLSVESVAGFKGLVTEDWQLDGEEARTAAFKLLAERVHPIALGDVYRARKQIELLAKKLLEVHRSDENSLQQIVRTLTTELGSHDYMISRTEARQLLGTQISDDDPEVEKLIWQLFTDFSTEMEMSEPYDQSQVLRAARKGGARGPVSSVVKLAIIESSSAGDVAEREEQLGEMSPQVLPGMPPQIAAAFAAQKTIIQAEVVRAGWRHYIIEREETK